MNDSKWFAGLWCRVCRLSPKRCTCYAKVDAPQYTRTMTMDDLRRNALESVIEDLKERDA